MLFDLEDYVNNGFIAGYNEANENRMKAPNQTSWFGTYTTFIATKAAFNQAFDEYFFASLRLTSLEDREKLIKKYDAFSQAHIDFIPVYIQFWNSLISLPITTLSPGDKFHIVNNSFGSQFLSESNEKYPPELGQTQQQSPTQVYATETSMFTLQQQSDSAGWNDLFVYTAFSKSLEQEYLAALKKIMSAAKAIVEAVDGKIVDA